MYHPHTCACFVTPECSLINGSHQQSFRLHVWRHWEGLVNDQRVSCCTAQSEALCHHWLFAAVTDVLLNSWWIWLNTMNERFTATGQQGLRRSLQCSTGLFCVLLCVVLKPRQSAEVVIGPENPEQKVTLKQKKRQFIRMTFWTANWWGAKHCFVAVNWHSSAGNMLVKVS